MIFLTLVWFVLAPSPVQTMNEDSTKWADAVVASLPLEVADMASGGYWKTDGSDGQYRVVVLTGGREHVSSLVYLQWIENDQARQELRVRQTTRIREIAEGFWSVGSPVFTYANKSCEIKLEATHTYSNESVWFVVTPGADGTYRFRKIQRRHVS
jgi:hypothetical protein